MDRWIDRFLNLLVCLVVGLVLSVAIPLFTLVAIKLWPALFHALAAI